QQRLLTLLEAWYFERGDINHQAHDALFAAADGAVSCPPYFALLCNRHDEFTGALADSTDQALAWAQTMLPEYQPSVIFDLDHGPESRMRVTVELAPGA